MFFYHFGSSFDIYLNVSKNPSLFCKYSNHKFKNWQTVMTIIKFLSSRYFYLYRVLAHTLRETKNCVRLMWLTILFVIHDYIMYIFVMYNRVTEDKIRSKSSNHWLSGSVDGTFTFKPTRYVSCNILPMCTELTVKVADLH